MKHGHGEMKWSDGRKYVGSWVDGRQDGEGVFTNSDGLSKKGKWKNGKQFRMVRKTKAD